MKRLIGLCLIVVLVASHPLFAEAPKKEDFPKLMKDLKSKDTKVRITALEAIGKLGSIQASLTKSAIGPIMELMKDSDVETRRAATATLGMLDPSPDEAIPYLTSALKDKEAKVRMAAADSLGQMGPDAKDAIPALREANGKEKDKGVLRSYGMALKRINAK